MNRYLGISWYRVCNLTQSPGYPYPEVKVKPTKVQTFNSILHGLSIYSAILLVSRAILLTLYDINYRILEHESNSLLMLTMSLKKLRQMLKEMNLRTKTGLNIVLQGNRIISIENNRQKRENTHEIALETQKQ